VAEHLTRQFGWGHWSSDVTDKSVVRDLKHSRILLARRADRIVGTLRLATKKPWAIDTRHFTTVHRPLYLLDMAVEPSAQRQGVGRYLIERAVDTAREWPADAIRLDAYDSPAGAGGFYTKCGLREVGRVVYRNVPLIYFELLI
jgi:GNAT superfamily N-acetyltransferase